MHSKTHVLLHSASLSIVPVSRSEAGSDSPSVSPKTGAALRSPPPACPFSRLAPAGTPCPVTGALPPAALVALPLHETVDSLAPERSCPVSKAFVENVGPSGEGQESQEPAVAVENAGPQLLGETSIVESSNVAPQGSVGESPPSSQTETTVVVAQTRVRRCPWWARLLRYGAKACAKHVVMRSLKPVLRNSVRTVLHVVRNISRPAMVSCPLAKEAGD